MMNTVNTEFSFVEVWFTDQSSKTLEIEELDNMLKIMVFCHLQKNLVIK